MVSPAKKFPASADDASLSGAAPGSPPLHTLPAAPKADTPPKRRLSVAFLLCVTALVTAAATVIVEHYTGLGWAWSYFSVINGVLFILSAYDRSVRGSPAWSVSEAVLLTVALLGGSVGLLVSMWLFRHKTSAPKFQIALLLIVVAQLAALRYLFPEALHSFNPNIRRAS